MIGGATGLYMRPVTQADIDERKGLWRGPYRAMSAYKGDEIKGERDWPWIVVGEAGVNCFGRLWPKPCAIRIAQLMNGAPT